MIYNNIIEMTLIFKILFLNLNSKVMKSFFKKKIRFNTAVQSASSRANRATNHRQVFICIVSRISLRSLFSTTRPVYRRHST